MKARHLGVTILAGLVLVTAFSVVYSRHLARKRFVEWQALLAERDALDIEWGQLRLEESAWATQGRVEQLGHDRLQMAVPAREAVTVVRP